MLFLVGDRRRVADERVQRTLTVGRALLVVLAAAELLEYVVVNEVEERLRV